MVKVTWILPALSIFTYFFSGSLCFRFDFKKGPSKLQAKSLLLPPVARISETSIASTRKEFIKYSHLNTFFKSALNIFDGKDYKSLGKIFTFDFVRDVIVIGLLSYSIKKILLFFYNMEKLLFQRMGEGMGSLVPDYENSIFGYIDAPLTRAFKLLFPLIYAVDLLSPVLSFFGIASEATKGYFDVCVFGTLCYFLGSLLTRVKDWIASKRRLLMVNLNPELVIDKEAARLTDDITSGLIWTAIIIYGLQSLKLSNRVWSKPLLSFKNCFLL